MLLAEPGKLKALFPTEAIGDNISEKRLHLLDNHTRQRYLIYTSSSISVFPRSRIPEKIAVTTLVLVAANSTTIKTYGQRILTLDFGLRREFRWLFVVVDVSDAIIGVDFLSHHKLLIDVKNRKLVDPLTTIDTPGNLQKVKLHGISTIIQNILSAESGNKEYFKILQEFKSITIPQFELRS